MDTMRRSIPFMLAALSATAPVAAAQQVSPPLKPYAPVAITLPAASSDASFAAFRAELAAVAKSRVYVALGRLVQPQGFFWDRDFARAFDPRKPAVDNLAAAIQLEHRNGSGWNRSRSVGVTKSQTLPLLKNPTRDWTQRSFSPRPNSSISPAMMVSLVKMWW